MLIVSDILSYAIYQLHIVWRHRPESELTR